MNPKSLVCNIFYMLFGTFFMFLGTIIDTKHKFTYNKNASSNTCRVEPRKSCTGYGIG